MDLFCPQQNERLASSAACKWNLAEAQQKLDSLALHNSESIDQEKAKAREELSELKRREQEWRLKEAALPSSETWGLSSSDAFSQDVFNRSFINHVKTREDDQSTSFIQKYEDKIRHFGMLRRWNDSQLFLSECPDLVCEETAHYLRLWCHHLQSEQKKALMEQVAHQAVVMQFIIEIAKSSNVDPRGCFRLFFQKARAKEEGYLEAFKSELEVFKSRVCMHVESQRYEAAMIQNTSYSPDMGHTYLQYQQNVFQSHPDASTHHFNPDRQVEEEDAKLMDTL